MQILIKNATVVTALDEYKADLLIENEKIVAIGSSIEKPVGEVVDAQGLYVLPGGVDQHTHFNFTFKTATVRGYETSNTAIASGTLSVSDSFHGVDYNSYEGMAFSRELRRVYLRGQLTFADGKFLGQETQGKFISSQPFCLCYDEF